MESARLENTREWVSVNQTGCVPRLPLRKAWKARKALKKVGPLRASARKLLKNEGVLIDATQGLQSRKNGKFTDVVCGRHGEDSTKYLWTIDDRGVNTALERTKFPTPRGNIVHTNLSSRASIGGEAWFKSADTVVINAGSGRFGDGAGITKLQWEATIKVWENLGYKVEAVAFGSR